MFKEAVVRLSESVKTIVKGNFKLDKEVSQKALLTDYKKRKEYFSMHAFQKALEEVRRESLELPTVVKQDPQSTGVVNQLLELIPSLETTDTQQLDKTVKKLLEFSKQLPEVMPKEFSFVIPRRIPQEIASEITADMKELEKCYVNNCYRSAVILCGRLLETALHRKYYEVTNFDILEKNPGIGLGNLVAKLTEKNVQLDPGLTQQIHLINQVRIFSVHKKKQSFYPSKEQTQAVILYTMDILKRLF